MIPLVVASERGLAQTTHVTACGVVGPRSRKTVIEKKRLESRAIDGDSPVF